MNAQLRNVSGEGAFIRATNPFPIGEQIHLRFQLEGKPVEAMGVVRHSEIGYGMGVQFLMLQPEHRATLAAYLATVLDRLGSGAYARVRKAPRIARQISVNVQGKNAKGEPFSEETHTADISDIGAQVILRHSVTPGDLLSLKLRSSYDGCWAQFRSVWQGPTDRAGRKPTGLELGFIDFWGTHNLPDQ